MVINLWYNKQMKESQRRWSLTETSVMAQHTGGQVNPFLKATRELRDAMNDVANTVEYMLDKTN